MIFLDTNVVSESLRKQPDEAVIAWLIRHDAEIAFGIEKIRPDQWAVRLEEGLQDWRRRFRHPIFDLTEDAALAYGEIMAEAARSGQSMSVQDGMIAAIVRVNDGQLATRNLKDFRTARLTLISPWDA